MAETGLKVLLGFGRSALRLSTANSREASILNSGAAHLKLFEALKHEFKVNVVLQFVIESNTNIHLSDCS